MAGPSEAAAALGLYQKELTEYDRHRFAHKPITDQVLKRTEMVDTLRTEFTCPICLDLLTKTMVTECLHRFCSECINKSIMKANRSCPTCRKKLISKRNLRADPNMDNLINTLWPDRLVYEALRDEQVQKWCKNIGSLQKGTCDGMQQQAKARQKSISVTTDSTEPIRLLALVENNAHESGKGRNVVASSRKRGRPPKNAIAPPTKMFKKPVVADNKLESEDEEELERKEGDDLLSDTDDAEDKSDDGSSSSSSSFTEMSSTSSSDEDLEGETMLNDTDKVSVTVVPKDDDSGGANIDSSGILVDVDLSMLKFNVSSTLPDDFNGVNFRVDDPPKKIPKLVKKIWKGEVEQWSLQSPVRVMADEDSGVFCSPPSATISPPVQQSLTDDGMFGLLVRSLSPNMAPMELAFNNYVDRIPCPLGVITVLLKPLAFELDLPVDGYKIKVHHGATMRELNAKLLEANRCLFGGKKRDIAPQIAYFVKCFNEGLVPLRPSDTVCTVLTLAKRAKFLDYPIIFFNHRVRTK